MTGSELFASVADGIRHFFPSPARRADNATMADLHSPVSRAPCVQRERAWRHAGDANEERFVLNEGIVPAAVRGTVDNILARRELFPSARERTGFFGLGVYRN